jgi:hypothetical protein
MTRYFVFKKLPPVEVNGKSENDHFACLSADDASGASAAVESVLTKWPASFAVGDWLMVFPGPQWFKVTSTGLKGVEHLEADFLIETTSSQKET